MPQRSLNVYAKALLAQLIRCPWHVVSNPTGLLPGRRLSGQRLVMHLWQAFTASMHGSNGYTCGSFKGQSRKAKRQLPVWQQSHRPCAHACTARGKHPCSMHAWHIPCLDLSTMLHARQPSRICSWMELRLLPGCTHTDACGMCWHSRASVCAWARSNLDSGICPA